MSGQAETGTPTDWDVAHREGFAQALEKVLGISTPEAFRRTMAMLHGEPLDTRRAQSGEQTLNKAGKWVPAIPLPLSGWPHLRRCRYCHAAYFTMAGYRGHYALEHILETP